MTAEVRRAAGARGGAADPPRLVALIPAAGGGSRFGSALPKQYADLGGRPLLLLMR